MVPQLKDYLITNWNRLFGDKVLPQNLSFLEIAGTTSAPGKVLFLIFKDNSTNPLFLAKVSRNQKDNSLLLCEYNNLQYIDKICSQFIKDSIPRPIFLEEIGNHRVLLETALEGKAISETLSFRHPVSKKIISRNCSLSIDWLIRFHIETNCKEKRLERDNIHTYIEEPIESFCSTFELNTDEIKFFQNLKVIIERLTNRNYPLVFQHGDFTPSNILISQNKFGIIDWEFSRTEGLLLHDLFFFLLWYGFAQCRKDVHDTRLSSFQASFMSKNWYSDLISRCIKEYCKKMHIAEDSIKLFFILFLINLANKEYKDLCRDAERGFINMSKGFSGNGDRSFSGLIKDGLYVNQSRLFIAQEKYFLNF